MKTTKASKQSAARYSVFNMNTTNRREAVVVEWSTGRETWIRAGEQPTIAETAAVHGIPRSVARRAARVVLFGNVRKVKGGAR